MEEEDTTENLSLSPRILYSNQSLGKSPGASDPHVWEGVKKMGDTTTNETKETDFFQMVMFDV